MSQEKKRCSNCNGSGSISCPACQGIGTKSVNIKLREGIQTKIVNCAACSGRRKVSCGACGGSGSN